MAMDLNRPYDTVLAWKLRKRIPEDAWPDVIAAAAKRGHALTLADILAVNTPPGRRGRKLGQRGQKRMKAAKIRARKAEARPN